MFTVNYHKNLYLSISDQSSQFFKCSNFLLQVMVLVVFKEARCSENSLLNGQNTPVCLVLILRHSDLTCPAVVQRSGKRWLCCSRNTCHKSKIGNSLQGLGNLPHYDTDFFAWILEAIQITSVAVTIGVENLRCLFLFSSPSVYFNLTIL